MQLDQTVYIGKNYFTHYGDGYVVINQTCYNNGLIVSPNHIEVWPVDSFDDLNTGHFTILIPYAPEIVLFGSGRTLRFVHPSLTSELTKLGIGFEMMDTKAACRTFNLLNQTERKVLIALINP